MERTEIEERINGLRELFNGDERFDRLNEVLNEIPTILDNNDNLVKHNNEQAGKIATLQERNYELLMKTGTPTNEEVAKEFSLEELFKNGSIY